jgi:hypothetical protein
MAVGTVPGPVAGVGEHEVGAVHLVAGGAETGPDRAGIGSGGAVAQETGGLGMVSVARGAGVEAEMVLRSRWMAPVLMKRARPWAKVGCWGRAASQMASRRAVTWSTGQSWASAAVP